MTEKTDKRPLSYKVGLWYGFLFSIIYLLYGSVKIILSILDRSYGEMSQLIIFTIMGLILITFAFAYKELRRWGWYGLIGINFLIIVNSLFSITRYESIILFLLSLVVMYSLLTSTTKEYLSGRR